MGDTKLRVGRATALAEEWDRVSREDERERADHKFFLAKLNILKVKNTWRRRVGGDALNTERGGAWVWGSGG